nr:shikimate kinase [Lachnospiraceae bacterium]
MSNVILIGYMGCGKSTVGRRLSYRLKMPYVDTDKLIEKKQMTTISHIFETQGEEAFRDMETDCLK